MEDVNISKFRAQVVRSGSTPASPGFVVSEGQDPVNPSGSSNYVPYSGAISNVDFGEFGLNTGFVTLDTTPTNIPTEQGGIYWDDSRSTAALIMNGTLQHIGQDTFFYVKNSTGSSIPKGTAVRFDGTDGASGHLKIAPFLANGTYPSNYFMGVTAEVIANGEFGQVMHFGELTGVNTSGYTAGALLYASTSVAGAFQTTAPVAPNNIVLVAAAINSTNNGTILVRPTYGSNINQDEGVKITSVANLNLLQYQSGTGLWENKSVATVMSNYVTLDGTQTISGAKTFTTATKFDAYIRLKHDINLDHISGYSTIGSDANNFFLAASSSKYAVLNVGNLTSQQTYTFPNASGTIALVGGAGVGTVTSVAALTLGTSGTDLSSTVANGTTTPVITLNVPTASASNRGALSAADWTTFNNKQNALTNPVTGTGTTNYLPKFTGSTTVGNSQIFDNGTNVGIGTSSPTMPIANRNGLVIRGGSNGAEFNLQSTSATDGTSVGFALVAFSTDAYYINRLDGNHIWVTGSGGNTERMRIWGSTGNVNIGTTPASDTGFKLDVNGTGRFTSSVTSTSETTDSSMIQQWGYSGNSSQYRLRLNTIVSSSLVRYSFDLVNNGTTYNNNLVLDRGNVGIGLNTPSTRFEVASGNSGSTEIQRWSYNDGNAAYSLRLKQDVSSGLVKHVFDVVNNSTTYSNNLVLTNGNVLIGTATDSGARLYVTGGIVSTMLTLRSNNGLSTNINFTSESPLGSTDNYTINHTMVHGSGGGYRIEHNVTSRWIRMIAGSGGVELSGGATSWASISDLRLKNIIGNLENSLDSINSLSAIKYTLKTDLNNKQRVGLIAQEVQKVLPECVEVDEKGMLSVRYTELIPLLVSAIKELNKKIK